MERKNDTASTRLRFNILGTIIYLIGIVLLLQLFNLQIVHGEEYREESNTRLTKETVLEAARGKMVDRTGIELASTQIVNSLELYKTKISNEELNTMLLEVATVLEQNGDSYTDNLPLSINPIGFTMETEEEQKKWKKEMEIDENATAEQVFEKLKEKYEITNENIEEVRKIMTLRYEINIQGYSSTSAIEIAENISETSLAIFNEQNAKFPGLSITQKPQRTYLKGNLASHVLGYMGRIETEEYEKNKDVYDMNDVVGTSGVEYVLEKFLRGTDGTKQIDMSVDGTVTDEYITKEAVAGNNVVLTIDAKLQQVVQDALKTNIEKIRNGGFSQQSDTAGGACIVMNVKTGEVLALASYPDFEPQAFIGGISSEKWNEYTTNLMPLKNRAIQEANAPGSIFKMITAIAALESGVTNTTEQVYDSGVYRYYNQKLPCWYYTDYGVGHRWQNVSAAIKNSCNYYFCEMGQRLGIDKLVEYASGFGLGKKTGIELLGETAGTLATSLNNEPGNILNLSIGQGANSFSVIQMAKYISMVANGGKDLDVTIIKSVIDENGNEIPKEQVEEVVNERLGLEKTELKDMNIKQENLQAVLEGMKSVTTESGGTANSFFRGFDIEVGGKTGSAEVGNGKVNAWFAGFAPYEDPEIAVVVMVENGKHGSYTAEPVRDIIAEYFGMNLQEAQESMEAIPTVQVQR